MLLFPVTDQEDVAETVTAASEAERVTRSLLGLSAEKRTAINLAFYERSDL